jgi:ribosome-binding ATPase YchF (GTP1/OBG family)
MCQIPSKCIHNSWIYSYPQGNHDKEVEPLEDISKVGKWLVFIDRNNIDRIWSDIKKATEKGTLGIEAKVSSKKQTDAFGNKKEHVICVYTKNLEDKDDVMRVRNQLRKLGINHKIPYKRDLDTVLGKYVRTTQTKISVYYD